MEPKPTLNIYAVLVKSTFKNLFEMRYLDALTQEIDAFSVDRTPLAGGALTVDRHERGRNGGSLKLSLKLDVLNPRADVIAVTFGAYRPYGTRVIDECLFMDGETGTHDLRVDGTFETGYQVTEDNFHTLGARIFKDVEQCFIPLLFWYDAAFGPDSVPLPGTTPRCDGCAMQLKCLQERGKRT